MKPTNVILDALAELLANDTVTIAPAVNACHVHLAMAPFTPGPDLVIGSFTEATFNTYAALDAGVGPQQNFVDPVSGDRIVQLLEPAGGWHWQAGSGANLPQTIYGYYVTDNADAVVFGSALLDNPVTLLAAGEGVDIGNVRFALQPGALG